jgi:hypothetical protein
MAPRKAKANAPMLLCMAASRDFCCRVYHRQFEIGNKDDL